MSGGGGNNKIFQYCTDPSGQEILYLRALQGHSGRNHIDPTLKDNVVITDGFFKYIYHVGSVTTECEGFCMPIKGKSKTTKKRTC